MQAKSTKNKMFNLVLYSMLLTVTGVCSMPLMVKSETVKESDIISVGAIAAVDVLTGT